MHDKVALPATVPTLDMVVSDACLVREEAACSEMDGLYDCLHSSEREVLMVDTSVEQQLKCLLDFVTYSWCCRHQQAQCSWAHFACHDRVEPTLTSSTLRYFDFDGSAPSSLLDTTMHTPVCYLQIL